jgi:hypothetical protein
MLDVSRIGPVEMLAVSFPGDRMDGQIMRALKDLTERGLIRVLDLMVLKKDASGEVHTYELDDLDDDIHAGFLPFAEEIDPDGLFGEDDLELAAAELQPGSVAALLVWEDRWASPIASAIREAGGTMLAYERVSREAVEEVVAAINGD